tara:strand:+ start:5 stop:1642 length:1638 start_codon:yes stop_codon:yes gene_type:complete
MKILLLFFYYFGIIFSIIGYGNLSAKLLKRKYSLSEIGFHGLLFLILISYITNFLVSHNLIHNIIILLIGLFSFVYFIKNESFDKKLFLQALAIFSILFIGLLMYKNHDDFFYYHFPYTLSLIEQKKIIGIGHLEHGFRTPSSIFYLNSLFYLPVVDYFLINAGAIFYMGFSNVFFLEKINKELNKGKKDFILFLSLISLIFVNTAFYRIAEHGTDRSALILVFVLVILYYETLKNNFLKDKIRSIYLYEKMIVVLLLIISLKSFYLIYLIFLLVWAYQFRFIVYDYGILRLLFKNPFTYILVFGVCVFCLTVFLNTSCLVYPASFTCFSSVEWSISIDQIKNMKDWYSLWSKAGANPNFRVQDPSLYLSNFNWISNWLSNYFFNKVSDFLLVIILISAICFFSIKNQKIKQSLSFNFNHNIIYSTIFILFLEWFINHPTLRYGGYSIIALLLFIPTCYYLDLYTKYSKKLKKTFYILIFVSFGIFLIKNVNRIHNEMVKYDYNPFVSPYFNIVEGAFYFSKRLNKLDEERKKNNKNYYITLIQN